MTTDLLQQLEQKVTCAVEIIELLHLQVEELEMENLQLKRDQAQWRQDLLALLQRLDSISCPTGTLHPHAASVLEEDFMTV